MIENLKKMAAEKAVDWVESGMVLGLGTGSTAYYAIVRIGELWQQGVLKDIVGIPTSIETAELAKKYQIPIVSLDDYPVIDVAIDGADEVDDYLNLIKGKGGALLREKIIAKATRRFIIVVDERKVVSKLGADILPVEVTQFAWRAHERWLKSICTHAVRRLNADGTPYITDNGNFIIHCTFHGGIDNPDLLSQRLNQQPGIIDHGLFLGMAHQVIIATSEGLAFRERPMTL